MYHTKTPICVFSNKKQITEFHLYKNVIYYDNGVVKPLNKNHKNVINLPSKISIIKTDGIDMMVYVECGDEKTLHIISKGVKFSHWINCSISEIEIDMFKNIIVIDYYSVMRIYKVDEKNMNLVELNALLIWSNTKPFAHGNNIIMLKSNKEHYEENLTILDSTTLESIKSVDIKISNYALNLSEQIKDSYEHIIRVGLDDKDDLKRIEKQVKEFNILNLTDKITDYFDYNNILIIKKHYINHANNKNEAVLELYSMVTNKMFHTIKLHGLCNLATIRLINGGKHIIYALENALYIYDIRHHTTSTLFDISCDKIHVISDEYVVCVSMKIDDRKEDDRKDITYKYQIFPTDLHYKREALRYMNNVDDDMSEFTLFVKNPMHDIHLNNIIADYL